MKKKRIKGKNATKSSSSERKIIAAEKNTIESYKVKKHYEGKFLKIFSLGESRDEIMSFSTLKN